MRYLFLLLLFANMSVGISKDMSLTDTSYARLIFLDRVTSISYVKLLHVGQMESFSDIFIKVHKCVRNNDVLYDDNSALISVYSDSNQLLFHGWIISSGIGVFSPKNCSYEIVSIRCKK